VGKKVKIILIVFVSITLLWIVMMTVDYFSIKNRKSPIFARLTTSYRDGGSKEYNGLGYSIFKYNTWDNCSTNLNVLGIIDVGNSCTPTTP